MLGTSKTIAAVLGACLLAACDDGGGGGGGEEDPCDHPEEVCPREGTTRCATATAVQVCAPTEGGDCLLWTFAETCGARQLCEDVGGGGSCVCIDACPVEGPTACDGDVVLGCGPDEDGCLVYSELRDCAAEDLVCDDSSGVPECEVFCEDRCAAVGDTECLGDSLLTCFMGPHGCLAERLTDCTEDAQVCDDSSGAARCATP